MITMNYTHQPMTGLSGDDYETLRAHAFEQVLAAYMRGRQHSADPETIHEASDVVTDALNNEWLETITGREWLTRVGQALGCDTSGCVGF